MTYDIRTAAGDRQVIRVFISSTFRDMHAERDAINRLVFPELRRRCLMLGAEFIGVDMRWGVTEDEIQREGTLAICLHEIERSRPFFVCLLAERFGSVYPPEEVSPALVEAARAVPALQSIADQWYRLDETVAPPVYRLHRALGPMMADEEAAALVRFWESRGLAGAGDSLTAREILRGVFEDGYPPTRALFYLRRSGLTHQPGFPAALVPVFVEQDVERRQKLATLKRRIRRQRPRHLVQRYGATYAGLRLDPALIPPDLPANEQAALSAVVTPEHWSGLSDRAREVLTHQGTVALSGMDTLAERMLDELWRAIEPELDRPAVQLDAHERERAYHERFVTRHTEFFRGREAERTHVLKYVGDTLDREVLVVTGEPGSGKSAFVAECVRACREQHPEALVIPHFIGAAPASAALPATLRSLCETLRREVGVEEAVAEDPDKLRVQLRAFLEQAGAKRPIILLLDALNQLDPAGRSHELDWLPVWAPPGTRIVVSTLEGDLLKQLTRRVPPEHVVTVPALPGDERRALVTDFLARRRKTLTPDQLNALLDVSKRPDAGLPLYTLVALEELCLFGDHEALIRRIRLLPATLPELFDQVLARVEQDHTRATVEAVCAWLAVARAGLLESEVLDLLGTEGAFPRIRWTRLYRALEPYLKPIEEDPGTRAGGRLDFYHDQLRSAVYRRYLHMAAPDADATDRSSDAHRQLAGYFRAVAYDEALPNKWRSDRVRGLSELPVHQTCAEMWEEVEATLCDLDFIEAKCSAGLTYDLARDYDAALAAIPEGRQKHQQVRTLDQRMAEYTHELVMYASPLSDATGRRERDINQVDGPRLEDSVGTPGKATRLSTNNQGSVEIDCAAIWNDEQILAESARILDSPTRADRLRAFSSFVNTQNHTLSRLSTRGGFSVVAHAYNSAADGPVGQAADLLLSGRKLEAGVLCHHSSRKRLRPLSALIGVLEGHELDVDDMAVTPDGRLAVSAGKPSGQGNFAVRIWDIRNGRLSRGLLDDPESWVRHVAVSADGRLALSAGRDIAFWDTQSGTRLHVWQLDEPAYVNVAITPAGHFALLATADSVEIWDTHRFESALRLPTHSGSIAALDWAANGRLLAIASIGDHAIKVWDVEKGICSHTFMGHSDNISSVQFVSDSRSLISGGHDGLRVWKLENGESEEILKGVFNCAAATADGRYALAGDVYGSVSLVDVSTKRLVRTFHHHLDPVLKVAITADGRRGVSVGGVEFGHRDFALRVWNLETGEALAPVQSHTNGVHAIAWKPDGSEVVSGGGDEERTKIREGTEDLWVWDTRSGTRVCSLPVNYTAQIAVTPDGNSIVAAGGQSISIWQWNSRSEVKWVRVENVTLTLGITPDGRRILRGGYGPLRIHNATTVDCLHSVGEMSGSNLFAVTPDGRWAVHAGGLFSSDATLTLSDIETGELLYTIEAHPESISAIAITPDGRTIVTASSCWADNFTDKSIRLWDLRTGKRLACLDEHLDGVRFLAVSPDGRYLMSGGGHRFRMKDYAIRIWDLQLRACIHKIAGHSLDVCAGVFTDDGRFGVSFGEDKTLQLIDIIDGRCLSVMALDAQAESFSLGRSSLVVGDKAGQVRFCALSGVGVPIVTATRLYEFGLGWSENVTARCNFCGSRFAVTEGMLASIREASERAGLAAKDAHGDVLLPDSETTPALDAHCPTCEGHLRFNTFLVDNR